MYLFLAIAGHLLTSTWVSEQPGTMNMTGQEIVKQENIILKGMINIISIITIGGIYLMGIYKYSEI